MTVLGPDGGATRLLSLLDVAGLKTQIRLRSKTVHAVDGISFGVAPGETLGLVGESGCGKTMTGMSIMRLLPSGGEIASGRIDFDGRDLAAADLKTMRSVRGDQIGMVFQDPMNSLNPTMTIGKQIASPVRLHRGVGKKEAMERAGAMLEPRRHASARRAPRRLPAPVIGGPSPAGHDRDGPRLPTETTYCRRADNRARRYRSGSDPLATGRLETEVRHGDDPDHPRHGRDRRPHGPRDGHVRRPDRGDGPH